MSSPCLLGQQRRLSAGVDHEPGRQLSLSASVRDKAEQGAGFFFAPFHATYPASLPHVYATSPGVFQENVVESGAPDLVSVGVLDAGLPEVPAPWLGVTAPDHGRAVLGQEPGGLHGFHGAQFLQHRHGGGQQRLAHVLARESFPLQQHHAPALASQHRRCRASRRPPANDSYVRSRLLYHDRLLWFGFCK